MNRKSYLKEKNKKSNQAQLKQNCLDSFDQELLEVQSDFPHVVDFYFDQHFGVWLLRTEADGWDLNEYESKKELLADLPNVVMPLNPADNA